MKRHALRAALAPLACWWMLGLTDQAGAARGVPQTYSIWLAPSGPQYDSLRTIVCELAARYASHCFMPHVTVVGDVTGTLEEITRRAATLAERTGALEARTKGIAWVPGELHRSFYLLVDETEGFAKLYADTCTLIGKCHTRPYHMSLMYTDQLSDSAKQAIRDSLSARWAASGYHPTPRLTRLLVCATAGALPEEWTCPREISLDETRW